MPELPEVEAVCQRLRRDAIGAKIVAAKIFRAGITRPQSARAIESRAAGRMIEAIRRRGKNILIDLTGGEVLHIHLRMTGDLRVIPDAHLRPAATRAMFEFSDGRAFVFDDARALGKLWLGENRLGKIGLEPLDDSFTFEAFDEIASRSRQPAKLFLMDQRHVAGIGNIYAAEILYRSQIDPRKPMNRISIQRRARMHASIIEVLREAVNDAAHQYGAPGDEFPSHVYGREGEPCPRCAATIRRITQGGRSTYFCARCQR